MGYYINPEHGSKEAWLKEHGEEIRYTEFLTAIETHKDKLPVCLVSNPAFSAAGIAYDQREVDAFARDDGRPKKWYVVSKKLLVDFIPAKFLES
jgi:hypothetical protein